MAIVMIVLTFLKNNWKPFALITLVAGIYITGRINGEHIIQVKWDASIMQQQMVVENQHLNELEEAKSASNMYQKQSIQARNELLATKGRLSDEIAKNHTYSNCHVTPGVVQLYEDVRSDKTSTPK